MVPNWAKWLIWIVLGAAGGAGNALNSNSHATPSEVVTGAITGVITSSGALATTLKKEK